MKTVISIYTINYCDERAIDKLSEVLRLLNLIDSRTMRIMKDLTENMRYVSDSTDNIKFLHIELESS